MSSEKKKITVDELKDLPGDTITIKLNASLIQLEALRKVRDMEVYLREARAIIQGEHKDQHCIICFGFIDNHAPDCLINRIDRIVGEPFTIREVPK